MNNEDTKRQVVPDSSDRVDDNNYDRGITPAETAARREREGAAFKHNIGKADQAGATTDDQTDPESIDTTGGYTTDKEGLANNYAIEPEMYVNEPGDLRQEEAELRKERIEEYEEANEDKAGELTEDRDVRGRGPGGV
jgi:hypothetical protein